MWTDAVISMLTVIAIKTKNLKSRRIVVLFQPSVKTRSIVKLNLLSMNISIVGSMIYGQKNSDGFSATRAPISSVSKNSLVLKSIIIIQAMLSMLIRIVFVPLRSFFNSHSPRLCMVKTFCFLFALFALVARAFVKFGNRFFFAALIAGLVHFASSARFNIIRNVLDYSHLVKRKAQRPERKFVGTSVPKRLAPRTGDDMVCSAWKLAAAL
jgi:hypothetical protein